MNQFERFLERLTKEMGEVYGQKPDFFRAWVNDRFKLDIDYINKELNTVNAKKAPTEVELEVKKDPKSKAKKPSKTYWLEPTQTRGFLLANNLKPLRVTDFQPSNQKTRTWLERSHVHFDKQFHSSYHEALRDSPDFVHHTKRTNVGIKDDKQKHTRILICQNPDETLTLLLVRMVPAKAHMSQMPVASDILHHVQYLYITPCKTRSDIQKWGGTFYDASKPNSLKVKYRYAYDKTVSQGSYTGDAPLRIKDWLTSSDILDFFNTYGVFPYTIHGFLKVGDFQVILQKKDKGAAWRYNWKDAIWSRLKDQTGESKPILYLMACTSKSMDNPPIECMHFFPILRSSNPQGLPLEQIAWLYPEDVSRYLKIDNKHYPKRCGYWKPV